MPYFHVSCANCEADFIEWFNEGEPIDCQSCSDDEQELTIKKEEDILECDFVNYFENELESANYHSMTDIPEKILACLKKNKISVKKRKKLLVELCEEVCRGI